MRFKEQDFPCPGNRATKLNCRHGQLFRIPHLHFKPIIPYIRL